MTPLQPNSPEKKKKKMKIIGLYVAVFFVAEVALFAALMLPPLFAQTK